jgi:hypothetical protein
MDINKDTGKGSQTIIISVQYSRTGPWNSLEIQIDPQDFIDAKSKEVYIRKIADTHSMGEGIVGLQHNYSVYQARRDLGLENT